MRVQLLAYLLVTPMAIQNDIPYISLLITAGLTAAISINVFLLCLNGAILAYKGVVGKFNCARTACVFRHE